MNPLFQATPAKPPMKINAVFFKNKLSLFIFMKNDQMNEFLMLDFTFQTCQIINFTFTFYLFKKLQFNFSNFSMHFSRDFSSRSSRKKSGILESSRREIFPRDALINASLLISSHLELQQNKFKYPFFFAFFSKNKVINQFSMIYKVSKFENRYSFYFMV